MQVTPVAFAATGQVGTPAHVAIDANSGRSVNIGAQQERVVGIGYTGFTAVIIHNGIDATGDVVAACGGAGAYNWNYEINCQLGIFLECTGAGRGTIWLV